MKLLHKIPSLGVFCWRAQVLWFLCILSLKLFLKSFQMLWFYLSVLQGVLKSLYRMLKSMRNLQFGNSESFKIGKNKIMENLPYSVLKNCQRKKRANHFWVSNVILLDLLQTKYQGNLRTIKEVRRKYYQSLPSLHTLNICQKDQPKQSYNRGGLSRYFCYFPLRGCMLTLKFINKKFPFNSHHVT